MHDRNAPFHAHVYYTVDTRDTALTLRNQLLNTMQTDRSSGLMFVGQMRDRKVGPHPVPQFEVHFLQSDMQKIVPSLRASGLVILVHPLTKDDLADHTTLGIGLGIRYRSTSPSSIRPV